MEFVPLAALSTRQPTAPDGVSAHAGGCAHAAAVPAAVASPGDRDARTRDRVVHLLLERGPSTAAALADALGLGAAAVRRHLEALEEAGAIVVTETRPSGRRGRPARRFALTSAGRAAAPHAYDGLAIDALRYLAVAGGEEAVASFARARVAALEARVGARLDGVPEADRADALARALSEEGYAAQVTPAPTGVQVCQHHCPVEAVAAEFPQLCEAETEALSRLLGSHVQRLATIAHGDGVCTTHIPSHIPSTQDNPSTQHGPEHRPGTHDDAGPVPVATSTAPPRTGRPDSNQQGEVSL